MQQLFRQRTIEPIYGEIFELCQTIHRHQCIPKLVNERETTTATKKDPK